MKTFEVTVNDIRWPKLLLIIRDGPTTLREEVQLYDTAFTAFEPHVREALRRAVDEVVRRNKPNKGGTTA